MKHLNIRNEHHDEQELQNFLPLLLDAIDGFNPRNPANSLDTIQYRVRELSKRNYCLQTYTYYWLGEVIGNINISVDILISLNKELLSWLSDNRFEVAAKYFSITLKLKKYSNRAKDLLSKA